MSIHSKNYFFGKYYKFISKSGFSFALIIGNSKDDYILQLITKDKSYPKLPKESVTIIDNKFILNIDIDDISIKGEICLKKMNPLRKKVMGPFTYIPFMECKHDIYSMYHFLEGMILVNNKKIDFTDGYGYIEGDKGRNFPKKYIWYNSVLPNASVTFAIASIPFGLFSFTGILGFIKINGKEWYLSTYNFAKALITSKDKVVIKKGRYRLEVNIEFSEGHPLKAPIGGEMNRYIKENVAVPSRYTLYYKDKVLITNEDKLSSYEWVYE